MINNNLLFKCNIQIHFDEKKHPSEASLCSNAFAFANVSANAAFALALAFDCHVMASFALAFSFDEFAFALAFDSTAFDWNQMRNKCELNATVLLLPLLHNGYFVSWVRLE